MAWAQFRALEQMPKDDAAALDKACRDTFAAARQAQIVGGDAPEADAIARLCYGPGRAS